MKQPTKAFVTSGEGNTAQYTVRQFSKFQNSDFKKIVLGYNKKFEDRLPDADIARITGSSSSDPSQTAQKPPAYDIIGYDGSKIDSIVDALNEAQPDVVVLIPPSMDDKVEITQNLIAACKKYEKDGKKELGVVLLSMAGVEEGKAAEMERLAEFGVFEDMVRKAGFARFCIVRAGFYTQNLLLYAEQMKTESVLPLPIGRGQFTPIDLHDVAYCLEKVAHTIDQKHHEQVYTIMGPETFDGPGLADTISKEYNTLIDFQDIPPEQAEKLLKDAKEEFKLDDAEIEVLLEWYELVKGKKLEYTTDDLRTIVGNGGSGVAKFLDLNAIYLNPHA